jgi:hypothetical protein
LIVGHGDLVQTYQEDCVHPCKDQAKEAVCQRALALNVGGFVKWLRTSVPGGRGVVVSTGQTQGAASAHAAHEANQVSVGSNQGENMRENELFSETKGVEVDWQAQLARESARHGVSFSLRQSGADFGADFCVISGLEQPRYSQKVERVERVGGKVVFLGMMVLEEEQFASS